MRIKIWITQGSTPCVMKSQFSCRCFSLESCVVPQIDCESGSQYAIFKHNGMNADVESFSIWGVLPGGNSKKILLTSPVSSDYISIMLDFCIPNNLENVKLTMKSLSGEVWSPQSYLSLVNPLTHITLLTTTLTEEGGMTIDFPRIISHPLPHL